jgi:hypothetical protein
LNPKRLTRETKPVTVNDQQFLRSLGWSILALIVSALLLVSALAVYTANQSPDGATNVHNKVIMGKELVTRMGTAKIDGDSLEITGFKALKGNQHALATKKTRFRAANYSFLAYKFGGQHAGMRINLIWRTAENPSGLATTPLNWNKGRLSSFNLTNQPAWRGTITEIGVHVLGEPRDEPVTVARLTLKPQSWQGQLVTIWSEWTAFRGWRPTSINRLEGTPGPATLSPTVAMAAWSAVAIVLLIAIGRLRRDKSLATYGAAILIPWIALDLLWQSELITQSRETKTVFGGKTTHEKHLADKDQHIYSYAKRLKEQVLPQSQDSRIFILHDSSGHNYDRLKTQYYLLPNNIYNYGSTPPDLGLRVGDFVLALGELPKLRYLSDRSELSWGSNKSKRVQVRDKDKLGTLYEILPTLRIKQSVDRNSRSEVMGQLND